MRHGAQARRMRGRNNHSNGGQQHHQRKGFQNKNKVFDSNGPDVRIRGTAFQIVEKYATLAKDAHATGDWVLAESYLQHAEHYQRMISAWTEEEANDAQYNNDTEDAGYDRFAVGANQSQPQASIPVNNGNVVNDDLALPASIIGVRATTEMAEA